MSPSSYTVTGGSTIVHAVVNALLPHSCFQSLMSLLNIDDADYIY